jgi:hypothetical protein
MGNLTERLESAIIWLSLLGFGVGFTLTATAAYYGSIFMALMAIFSFGMGELLYGVYRAPSLLEDANSPDERRKREAMHELGFLIAFLLVTIFSYVALADVFYGTFSGTEAIAVYVLPSSLGLVGLAAFLFEFLKRSPRSLLQPEENWNQQ